MKRKPLSNQDLTRDRHYVLPVPLHDTSPAPGRHRFRAPRRPMSLPSLTFAQLKARMSERSHAGHNISAKSLPNALSALAQFMHERGCTDDQPIGTVLRAGYYRALAAHIAALKAEQRSAEYIRNRKTLLKRWRELLLELDRAAAAQTGSETPFQRALNELFDGAPALKTIAARTGVPLATLKRWRKGSLPKRKALHHVQSLERYFGQAPGTLSEPLWPRSTSALQNGSSKPAPQQRIPYRERLCVQSKLEYALRNPSPELRAQWSDLLAHKTSVLGSGLKRYKKGKWSVTHRPVKRARELLHWYACVTVLGRAMYCPTAAINWCHVSQYLGWLGIPEAEGGAGVLPGCNQSLVCLTDVPNLERYVEWKVARSGGVLHRGISGFLKLVASLCHPVHGYLTQARSQFSDHPDATSEGGWAQRCQRAFESARALLQQVEEGLQSSRDSCAPIAYILSLANPLSAVVDAITRMDAARPSTGGQAEAIWARDRLMLKLLASNPLRAKNLKLLTVFQSASGEPAQLRKVDGQWRIGIDRKDFKNMAGAAKDRVYDMPVRPEVCGDLETYLRVYRPLLADTTNPYLLVSSASPAGPMHGLNRRFEALSRRYFAQCPGVGPHAMRHIVATTILKMHPNAWAAAAYVLHDQEETVRKHYSHLCGDDAARWVDALMTKALTGA